MHVLLVEVDGEAVVWARGYRDALARAVEWSGLEPDTVLGVLDAGDRFAAALDPGEPDAAELMRLADDGNPHAADLAEAS
jgi:hypothetical protein